jgi:2-polyprenyl-6-methoxyphenol hydroxylase-like FAD-dependent oxidoreductase
LLESLNDAPELYFDSISRVSVPHWTKGRVTLLGDAGFGVTLGGMGVGTGIVGAYMLAGELASARGDHTVALAAYEARLRPYAARWQRGANPGRFLAPATAKGLWFRKTLLGNRLVQRMLVSSTKTLATTVELPAYS